MREEEGRVGGGKKGGVGKEGGRMKEGSEGIMREWEN